MRAIHQKEMVFSLLATLIILHVVSLFIWQVVIQKWSVNRSETFVEDVSDQICKVECVSWLFILMTTGFIALYEYIVVDVDELVNLRFQKKP